jgi:hypothetical protein
LGALWERKSGNGIMESIYGVLIAIGFSTLWVVVVGFIFSLLGVIPSIRTIGINSAKKRITKSVILGILCMVISLLVFTLLLARLSLTIDGIFCSITESAMTRCEYYSTMQADYEEHGTEVVKELWRRIISPPLSSETCYSDQQNICKLAGRISDGSAENKIVIWGNYFWIIGLNVITGFICGVLIWRSTRS